MPCFQEMFERTKGKPIEYEGNVLVMMDTIPLRPHEVLKLVFESSASEWRQGACVWVNQGKVRVDDTEAKGVFVWEDTAPREVRLALGGKGDSIHVKNIWDTGNGMPDSWHNGAAMIVEELPNGRRYRCNDGHPDDDFNDIVFRIERIE